MANKITISNKFAIIYRTNFNVSKSVILNLNYMCDYLHINLEFLHKLALPDLLD